MEEIKENKNSKFFKELENRSKSVDTSNKLNFAKAIMSVLNLASLIWIFNICFRQQQVSYNGAECIISL